MNVTGIDVVRLIGRAALLAAVCSAGVVSAQTAPGSARAVSTPVVQPTGNKASARLNQALVRLAANPQELDALLEASDAALALGDVEAAIGFLTRADQVSPGNARIKAAIGSALVRNENPYDAIAYFDQAEAAGADIAQFASDRGLAFDLVGDSVSAQTYHKLAVDKAPGDEAVRRYALSLAISGDRRTSDGVLSPLIQKQDPAAWRTRTFVMAITGSEDEAVSIAQAMMPKDLAEGITPYLRYMPRLTRAQQVAAATFGKFPRAAEIGRDDPRVAQFAALPPRRLPGADAGLIPTGEPLGKERRRRPGAAQDAPRTAAAAPAPREDKRRKGKASPTQVAVAAAAAPPVLPQTAASAPASAPAAAAAPVGPQISGSRSVAAAAAPPLPPAQPLAGPAPAASPQVSAVPVSTAAASSSSAQPVLAAASHSGSVPAPGFSTIPAPAAGPAVSSGAVTGGTAPAAPALLATPAAAPAPAPAPVAAPPAAARVDFASVFGGFAPPPEESSARTPAVDITRITPARPAPPPAPPKATATARSDAATPAPGTARSAAATPTPAATRARASARPDGPTAVSRGGDDRKTKGKPAPPSHPSRIWVQVLTGGSRDLLPTEWRRLVRQAPEALRARKAYVTPWRSNFRLLTGPFESEAAAQTFLNQLRRADVPAFLWTSAAGQAVDALPAGR